MCLPSIFQMIQKLPITEPILAGPSICCMWDTNTILVSFRHSLRSSCFVNLHLPSPNLERRLHELQRLACLHRRHALPEQQLRYRSKRGRTPRRVPQLPQPSQRSERRYSLRFDRSDQSCGRQAVDDDGNEYGFLRCTFTCTFGSVVSQAYMFSFYLTTLGFPRCLGLVRCFSVGCRLWSPDGLQQLHLCVAVSGLLRCFAKSVQLRFGMSLALHSHFGGQNVYCASLFSLALASLLTNLAMK